MSTRQHMALSSAIIGMVCGAAAWAQELEQAHPHGVAAEMTADGGIMVDGRYFESWPAYWQSDFFRDAGMRCGTVPGKSLPTRSQTDCDMDYTDPADAYSPEFMRYRIPVVVHVIRTSDGATGHITSQQVQSQIDVLNEDYLAITGTNGQNGTDVQIEFYLATTDPNGDPTSGITYSNNTNWFNDGGSYWDTLAWDPDRYLNIYTNMAGGYLGYVPDLPQSGSIVGENWDRVVILWSAFGSPGAGGAPYDLGRTATHEVGHYLGLYHPFQDGCPDPNDPNELGCYYRGDCICDTNPDETATLGCPVEATSCNGFLIPIENYMEYTDDDCMEEFTPEQTRRLRCTLEYWRPDLFERMTVWADFDYSGTQEGTYGFPFNTLAQALAEVISGGTIKMKPGWTSETPIINQAVTLEAFGGTVVIGQ